MNISDLLLQSTFLVKLIIIILLILSILSWSIIINRTRILNIATREAGIFEDQFWSGIELSRLYQIIEGHRDKISGFERIFYSGFKEFTHLHNANKSTPEVALKGAGRAMRISINREIESLENQVPFLGTIGSISPYIGLLGTVWGIIHAFIVFGSVKQVTLQMIAPRIAESLIATAIGLFVAIPAVIAYNLLNQRIGNLELNYDNFMEEVMAILHRKDFLLDNIELNKG